MAIRVITTNPSGGGYDITDLIDNLSWSSVSPGGDERATFTFRRSWFSENPEIAKGAKVRIEDGLQRLWSGRVEERSRGGQASEEINVTCYGPGQALKDNLMNMIYVDRDLSGWTDLPLARRLVILSVKNVVENGTQESDNATPALFLKLQAGTSNGHVEAWYDAGEGNTVGSIYYDATSKSTSGCNGELSKATGPSAAPTAVVADFLTGTDSSQSGTATMGERYALWRFFNSGTVPTNEQNLVVKKLTVFGDHGLTKRGSAGSEGFYDSDIVQHVISQLPGVTARQIDAGSFVIQQAAYKDKVQHEQIINDVSQYENRDWGTWGSDDIFDITGNAQFDYKLKDTTTRHWTVSREDAEDLDLADELAGLYDTAVVKYTDESGTQRMVSRTATIPELAAAGLSPKTVEISGGQLTQAGAETLGDIALALYGGFAPARGSLTLKGDASHYQRGEIPAHFMRADGSNIQVRDILPSTTALALDSTPDRRTTFPMKRVSVDCSGAVPSVTVDLDQSNDRLTQLQARTGVTAQVTLG